MNVSIIIEAIMAHHSAHLLAAEIMEAANNEYFDSLIEELLELQDEYSE